MNAQDLIALIRALKEAGVTSFSHGDFKITFHQQTPYQNQIVSHMGPFYHPQESVATQQSANQVNIDQSAIQATQTPAEISQIELDYQRRLKEMISTMAASPEDLANKIFPAGATN